MPRGYPDFSGALAFPNRKIIYSELIMVAVADGAGWTDIFRYAYQLQTEGGSFGMSWTGSPVGIELRSELDGNTLPALALSGFVLFGYTATGSWPYQITQYDPDVPWACFGFTRGFYAGAELALQIKNTTGAPVDVWAIPIIARIL